MRPRTKPREAAPGDEEILAYDNVPVDVAARYLDWPEQTVRLALRELQDGNGVLELGQEHEAYTRQLQMGHSEADQREIRTALRQRRRRKTLSYGEVPDEGKEDAYFTSLRDALPPELGERDREILIAYYGDQIGYEELSKRLGISVNQCRVQVFRAKNRYRKLLEAKKIPPAVVIKAPAETIRETGGDPDASR